MVYLALLLVGVIWGFFGGGARDNVCVWFSSTKTIELDSLYFFVLEKPTY